MKIKNYLIAVLMSLFFVVGNIYAQEQQKDSAEELPNASSTVSPLVELSYSIGEFDVYVLANVKSLEGVKKVIWTYSPNPEGGNMGGVTKPVEGGGSFYLQLPRRDFYRVTFSLDPRPEGEPNYYMIEIYDPK